VLKWHEKRYEKHAETMHVLAPPDFEPFWEASRPMPDFSEIRAEVYEQDNGFRRIKVRGVPRGGLALIESPAPTGTVKTALLMLFLED
jgi:hypothetical protein